MRFDRTQLQFLARLCKSPDGAILLQILRVKQAEADQALRKARGEDVYRAQGRAEEIDDLLAMIEDAPASLNRDAAAPKAPRGIV